MIWLFTFLILSFIILPIIFGVVLVIAAVIDIFLEGVHHRYIEGIVEKKLSSSDIKKPKNRKEIVYDYFTGKAKPVWFNSWGTIWIDGERYFLKENKMRLFRQIVIGQKIKISVSKSNRVLKMQ